jgi:hypothetical protein
LARRRPRTETGAGFAAALFFYGGRGLLELLAFEVPVVACLIGCFICYARVARISDSGQEWRH